MGNIHVKLYGIWTRGAKGDVVLRHFLSRALIAPLFSRPEPFVLFCTRYHEEHLCEINLNLDHWFRRRGHLKTFLI